MEPQARRRRTDRPFAGLQYNAVLLTLGACTERGVQREMDPSFKRKTGRITSCDTAIHLVLAHGNVCLNVKVCVRTCERISSCLSVCRVARGAPSNRLESPCASYAALQPPFVCLVASVCKVTVALSPWCAAKSYHCAMPSFKLESLKDEGAYYKLSWLLHSSMRLQSTLAADLASSFGCRYPASYYARTRCKQLLFI